MSIHTLLAVAVGGAIGSLLRYTISLRAVDWFGADFPYGTLLVNTLGSLLMGFLVFYFHGRVVETSVLRPFLLIGLLGGFTTFSAFSMETLALFSDGSYFRGLINVIISVVLCIVAAALGMLAAKQI